MTAVATEAREILAEIAIAACEDSGDTDATLACFDAAEQAVVVALKPALALV
jgi:hypothetical protein